MKKTSRKKIYNVIEVPEGVNVEIDGKEMKISKGGEELKIILQYEAKKENHKIIVSCENPSKKDKKLINTTTAHIKNMIAGLEKKFVYKLQIVSVHFPMNVSVSNGEFIIKNFLGETKERKAKILDGVEVKVEGEVITVASSDKEKAGQTAGNIERATKIKKRDVRIFQDGIYITEKMKGSKWRKK